MAISNETQKKFFEDPAWGEVEEEILGFIQPLVDMNTIDMTQPAEHVKAEVIGRIYAYNALIDFLNQSHIVGREMKKYKNPFA